MPADLGHAGLIDGFAAFDTALGTCGVRWSAHGITEVLLPPARTRGGESRTDPSAAPAPAPVREAIAGIVALLAGERRDLRAVVLDERAVDPFRLRVYAAAREIAPGTTVSYGEVAAAIGEPGAARAVGAALGANPFPIIVPCHRVLAATGALHGFSAPGGITTKRRMLEIERAPGFTQQALFA
ncbi:MAG TPA: methylated-DNA--[protein]-cysteine S-methyltransferase [Solirubrobacteraceae bacterium]|nr:methylated-DNA--[protein]-cysteine S-methyltransferase [Solirubrobacteraceae bacterium]